MRSEQPNTIYLQDYQAPIWQVDDLQLRFELGEDRTTVTSTAHYQRTTDTQKTLVLFGEQLQLVNIVLNGEILPTEAYERDEQQLIILNPPDMFELCITTQLEPQNNHSLEGLYKSSGNFCTQCEAQGFRKITYYQDRPDVLTVFTTEIVADKTLYPVLLSNGNLIDQGELGQGRHWAKWHDPFPKPAYLFALVAGDLQHVEDCYTTVSGRDVTLRIYTEAHNIDKCDHAMASLQRSMQWDEQRFGLEYDLDIYMIVAVDDFNMGAMENKGLNIFNSKLVFASPETATDNDYINVEAVIGHEYFHNWTGNRVTCRDWFQLSLKEGLTVFRDQEFTSDLHSRSVKRIEDVRMLRTYQFAEDASPMAHPIRPASYIEINNFYTVTVYEKGAEVVRMYDTLLGQDGFRRGMDLYFERHDGQAVTTENFLAAMADANESDLSQMQVWYEQAGTPQVSVNMDYDADQQICTLHFQQSCPATPETKHKRPYLIPIELGLLNSQGQDMPLQLQDEASASGTSRVVCVTEAEQSFTFINVPELPLPSILRGFSAPVKLDFDYSEKQLAFLMQYDSDAFNRWDAGHRLAMRTLLDLLDAYQQEQPMALAHHFVDAFQTVLCDETLDYAFRAEALSLPSEVDIAEQARPSDPAAIHHVREFVYSHLAKALRIDLERCYQQCVDQGAYQVNTLSVGKRSLKNVCLTYLGRLDDEAVTEMCQQQYQTANNMTDAMAALMVLNDRNCPEREVALQHFQQRWQDNALVMDKWFALQATSKLEGSLQRVKGLMQHASFDLHNPNKVRALIGAFAMRNPLHFHADDGAGYRFLADCVLQLDGFNPQIAARLVRPLMNWRQFEQGRSEHMKAELQRIHDQAGLSKDVFEIVSKSLG